ncbi:TetR family transcriptional regulator C-terminal domain-containing protein [Pseudomonas sp.]|uniref:TetR/AcrR family transcriptional regulator n=1 Tax=Pseudomonas sp. TaxID=306 RepID=UPI003CC6600C
MSDAKAARQHILDSARPLVGSRGFGAVGLTEVLKTAGIPKGSFYHYFASKDAFGEALLQDYFDTYLQQMQRIFDGNEAESRKLLAYWQHWADSQACNTDAGKCLVVKLGAEVADLSDAMRQALDRGTARIIQCLAGALARGQQHGAQPPEQLAAQLYALWLGASVMAKITRTRLPFDEALAFTRQALGTLDSF